MSNLTKSSIDINKVIREKEELTKLELELTKKLDEVSTKRQELNKILKDKVSRSFSQGYWYINRKDMSNSTKQISYLYIENINITNGCGSVTKIDINSSYSGSIWINYGYNIESVSNLEKYSFIDGDEIPTEIKQLVNFKNQLNNI